MSNPLTELRKSPIQHRATATFDAILEAAAHILAQGDADTLTTNKIAERAGVSIGSVYQYFPNKSAIVRALIERQIKHAELSRPAALDDVTATSHTVLAAAVNWWFDLHMIEPKLASALRALSEKLLPKEELRRLSDLRNDRLRQTASRLIADESRLDHVAFVLGVCLSALSNQTLLRQPEWLSSEKFRAEVATLLERFIE